MAKKVVLILAAAMLSLVIMSSEVAAMELALNNQPTIMQEKATETDNIENAKYGGYENNGRGGYTKHIGGYGGSGAKDCKKCCIPVPFTCLCCGSANEVYDVVNVGIPHNKVVIYV